MSDFILPLVIFIAVQIVFTSFGVFMANMKSDKIKDDLATIRYREKIKTDRHDEIAKRLDEMADTLEKINHGVIKIDVNNAFSLLPPLIGTIDGKVTLPRLPYATVGDIGEVIHQIHELRSAVACHGEQINARLNLVNVPRTPMYPEWVVRDATGRNDAPDV